MTRAWTGALVAACLWALAPSPSAGQPPSAPGAEDGAEDGGAAVDEAPGNDAPGRRTPGGDATGDDAPSGDATGDDAPSDDTPSATEGDADASPDADDADPSGPGDIAADDTGSSDTGSSDTDSGDTGSDDTDSGDTGPTQDDAGAPADPDLAAFDDGDLGEPGELDDFDDVPTGPTGSELRVRYFLERVEIRGNERTRGRVIRSYVPFEPGEVLDPEDEDLEAIRWRLRGTGWFDRVRLRLEPGARRGWVVLVITVEERNTIVLSGLTFGISEGLNNSEDTSTDVVPYVGATLTETNLFGSGARLSLGALGSPRAWGFELDFEHPRLLPRDYSLRVRPFYHRARQYFGNDPLISQECPDDVEGCAEELEARNAVVFYQRGGLLLGTGHDLGAVTRLTLAWQGEVIHLRSRPEAASESRGGLAPSPIDFTLHDRVSYLSSIQVGLSFDKRDDPAMTTRGVLARFGADLSHNLLGSDYDFVRFQLLFRAWQPLPWGHTLRFNLFAGAVFGEAPFFYQFQIADLTDLIPGRMLDMQLDRRAAPDLLGTAISVMRTEELAGRLDLQYELPLYRSRSGIRAVNGYLNVGVLFLADPRDLEVALPAYRGASRAPLDLTFDIGLRMDTRVGVFQFGFSTVLGLVTL
ncbi:MAG TPA: BamA/TamA family outer membrane protein [Polyangiaceae bacterium LLY-WYZ-15_(1-7)]|nr:hypothetical protein [Myxococcales bacterium]MBJ75334.1 hypothetical protein [Sandaracinus sp.]HJL05001.1 BamA/TamA family outer membrane protein [Polyangiaceae bacterium LLY-WYZ-15_(1-7)]HJL09351.1 BamA/TamA family outer membrane protein [Polyangiaceae bacterium LLY-WYZ-15_(1-7)]HJL24251.1 BamA/TamA family outer membrane protein [Polyangiaceae bacterium LLY-WYZ-15_(1-7)]